MFKKTMFAILLATASSSVFSASGSATIPHFLGGPGNPSVSVDVYVTVLYFSNVTDKPINVSVKLFKHDGTLLTDDGSATTGQFKSWQYDSYNDNVADKSVVMTIQPNSTSLFSINPTQSLAQGYGVIEWEQNGNAVQGLVSHGRFYRHFLGHNGTHNLNEMGYSIPINSGMPF